MHKGRWILISCLFLTCTAVWTALAWDGSNFPLLVLASLNVILSVLVGVYGVGWRSSIERWRRSTTCWQAAQNWGIKENEILADALRELAEYDQEAHEIHSGRATVAGLEYLTILGEEFE